MRENVAAFVAEAAEALDLTGPVVEIGSRPAEGQEDSPDFRRLFPNDEYIGCDAQPGRRVDRVEDVHGLTFDDEFAGTILALDTLEHVRDPIRGVAEMYRVLRPGGTLIVSSVMFFPIHAHPYDYWRFTPDGFRSLLAPFPTSLVMESGWHLMPETVYGVGVKDPDARLDVAMFPDTVERARSWAGGLPVDLGPIRLGIRQTWRLALGATITAARTRLHAG